MIRNFSLHFGGRARPPSRVMRRNARMLHSSIQVMDAHREAAGTPAPAHLLLLLLGLSREIPNKPSAAAVAIAMARRLPCVCLLAFVIFKGKTNSTRCSILFYFILAAPAGKRHRACFFSVANLDGTAMPKRCYTTLTVTLSYSDKWITES